MPTFVFTDIEGSTKKWQEYPDSMGIVLTKHDAIISESVVRFSGRIVKHTGDGFMVVFGNGLALECSLSIQQALGKADWSAVGGLPVRIGVHSGDAVESAGDFFGRSVNRASRIMSAAWGGQIVVSSSTAAKEILPDGATLVDAGIHMLRDLLEPEQLFALSHSSIRSDFPTLTTISSHPHRLPVQPTPFVGRDDDLRRIIGLLSEPGRRLVTILGHGGSGKTRIALQAAAELVHQFKHGAWFVALEDMNSVSGLVSKIAESLSLGFAGNQDEEKQLESFLSGREALLVLDNFEHVTKHSSLVSRLLASSPELKVLATSRHRLGIREESLFDLSGMALPNALTDELERFDSTSLFLASARRTCPSFSPGPEDRAAIFRICRMLEGLPLAIELSASWIRTISCQELEQELQKDLDLLESNSDDVPERQRSIEAVFDYSWNLLSEEERKALAGLSVFEGGFDREAASAVAGCSLKILQRLLDQSLVRNRPVGGYALHPLTKQQAAEKQGIVDGGRVGLEDRHSEFYRCFLDTLHPDTRSNRQTQAFEKIALEMPNLRKGAIHAFRHFESERMGSYAKTVSVLLQLRSRFTEALELFTSLREVFNKAVSERPCDEKLKTKTMAELDERIGTFLLLMGRCHEAEQHLRTAVDLACTTDDLKLRALCYGGLGNAAIMLDANDRAEECWETALSLARECGIANSASSLLCNLATVKKRKGQLEEAMRFLEQAEELNRAAGDPYISSALLSQMADIRDIGGDAAGAEDKYRESLLLKRQIGDLRGISLVLEKLSKYALSRSPAEALVLAEEGLRYAGESGAANRIVYCRLQRTRVLASMGRFEEAIADLDVADREADSMKIPAVAEECAAARAFVTELKGLD